MVTAREETVVLSSCSLRTQNDLLSDGHEKGTE